MNMWIFNIYILFLVICLAVGFSPAYSQDSEKTPDSTDTALVDGVKQIQDMNVENKMENTEDQGLDVEVEKPAEVNTVTEDTAKETMTDQEEVEDTADLGGVNPDLMVPQPRLKIDEQRQKPIYDASGKRDPFKPFIKTPKEKQAVISAATPPIKRFPLDEYRIAGIVWIDNIANAMIVDPEGNTYLLTVNDEIGNRNGVILEVNENGILVNEKRFFEDVFGEQKVEVTKVVLAFVREDEQ